MRLKQYLEDTHCTVKAFADRIGVSHSSVVRYANGDMLPSLEIAVRIERETGGQVMATDFFAPPAESESAA